MQLEGTIEPQGRLVARGETTIWSPLIDQVEIDFLLRLLRKWVLIPHWGLEAAGLLIQ